MTAAPADAELEVKLLELLRTDLEFRTVVTAELGLLEILERLDRHEERMARLEERMLKLKERMEEHSRIIAEHTKAIRELQQ